MPKHFPLLSEKSEDQNYGAQVNGIIGKPKISLLRGKTYEAPSASPPAKEEWREIVLKPTKRIQRTKSQEEREEVHLKPVLKTIKSRDIFAPPGELDECPVPEEEEEEPIPEPKKKVIKPPRKRMSIIHNENLIDSKAPEKLVFSPPVIVHKATIIEPPPLPVIEESKVYVKSDHYFKIVVQEGSPFRFIPVRAPTEEDLEIWDDDILGDKSLTDAEAQPKYYLKIRHDDKPGLFTFKPIPKRINRIRKNQLGEDILEMQDITIYDEKEVTEYYQEIIDKDGKLSSIFQPAAGASDRDRDAIPKRAGRRKSNSVPSKETYKAEPIKYYEKTIEGDQVTFTQVDSPSIEETTHHVKGWGIEAPLYYTKWVEPGGLVVFHPIPRVGKRTKREKVTRNRRTEVIEIKTTYEGIHEQHFVEKQDRHGGHGRVTFEAVQGNNVPKKFKKRKSDAK